MLRHWNWRVLGTRVDLLGWIGALWAALYAVGGVGLVLLPRAINKQRSRLKQHS